MTDCPLKPTAVAMLLSLAGNPNAAYVRQRGVVFVARWRHPQRGLITANQILGQLTAAKAVETVPTGRRLMAVPGQGGYGTWRIPLRLTELGQRWARELRGEAGA